MAFGQTGGPPASAKLVSQLLTLVQEAGYSDFRDARGALGLTQRQAGGKFTPSEAEELVQRLSDEAEAGVEADRLPAPVKKAAVQLDSRRAQLLAGIPDVQLADELVRRGWAVIAP